MDVDGDIAHIGVGAVGVENGLSSIKHPLVLGLLLAGVGVGVPGDFAQHILRLHLFHLLLGRIENGDLTGAVGEDYTLADVPDDLAQTEIFLFQVL